MLRLLISASVLLAAVPAAAEDWRLLGAEGDAPDRGIALIDASSVDWTDSYIPRFKMALLRETPGSGGMSTGIRTLDVDCDAMTLRMVHAEVRSADGTVLADQAMDEDFAEIVPDSYDDLGRLAVCEEEWGVAIHTFGDLSLEAIAAEYFGS